MFQKGDNMSKVTRVLIATNLVVLFAAVITMVVAMCREFGVLGLFGKVDSLFVIVSLWGKYIEYRIGFITMIVSAVAIRFLVAVGKEEQRQNRYGF